MHVLDVSFIGVRTEQFESMVRFFAEVMSLDVTRSESDLAGFRLAGGTTVEVYSPADDFHGFFGTGPMVAFRVADFDEAHSEMLAAGVEFIGPIQHDGGTSWNHFRAPDGNVYEIVGPGQPPQYEPEQE